MNKYRTKQFCLDWLWAWMFSNYLDNYYYSYHEPLRNISPVFIFFLAVLTSSFRTGSSCTWAMTTSRLWRHACFCGWSRAGSFFFESRVTGSLVSGFSFGSQKIACLKLLLFWDYFNPTFLCGLVPEQKQFNNLVATSDKLKSPFAK